MIALGAVCVILVATLLIVLREHDRERDGWIKERSHLLNRIQAPDVAVAESWQPAELSHAIGYDNDEEYWEAKAEMTNGD